MNVPVLEQIVAGRSPDVLPLSVDQYHRMIETGIIREGDPRELIDGIMVRKDRSDRGANPMAHGPRHALVLKRLERLLRGVENFGYHLPIQLPVTLSAVQEPEPALAVVRGTPEDYQHRHPGPGDIFAVVEVSDSTLDYDRTAKQRIYAGAGIPRYWLVNLPEERIEVYEQPIGEDGRYERMAEHSADRVLRMTFSTSEYIDVSVRQVLSFDSDK